MSAYMWMVKSSWKKEKRFGNCVMKNVTFDVVGALIEKDGKYLVCKRKSDDRFGSLWEFPGGKVEHGEDKTSALKREIKEELGIEIDIYEFIHIFEDEVCDMKIVVYLYRASIKNGNPECIECDELKWLSLDEIGSLNLAPADKKVYFYLLNQCSE